MIRFGIVLILGIAVAAVVYSKMDPKTEATVNGAVSAQVDTVSTVALDGVQAGLNKANTAITEGRKPAKK